MSIRWIRSMGRIGSDRIGSVNVSGGRCANEMKIYSKQRLRITDIFLMSYRLCSPLTDVW